MKKLTLVKGDDWMGVYVDGKLEHQDHNISERELLSVCGIKFEDLLVDLDWLDTRGHLPDNFKDIPKNKLTKRR